MNLKEILVAERDRVQGLAEKLQLLATNLNATIAAMERVPMPALVEVRVGQPNAKAIAEAVPAEPVKNPPPATQGPQDTEFDNAETIGGERFLPADRLPAESTATRKPAAPVPDGEMTMVAAAAHYDVRPNTIGIWVKYGKVSGGAGRVNVASLERHLASLQEEKTTREPAQAEPGEMSYAEAAELVGVTPSNFSKNQVYQKKVVKTRTGYVTRASVEAYIARRDADPRALSLRQRHATKRLTSERTEPGEKSAAKSTPAPKPVKEKFRFDDPKPIVKDQERATGPWNPEHLVGDQYVAMDKAAKQLNCNMDWLRMVKKSGRIAGAPDWINITQLEAYLKHPDFEEPLIDRAPGSHERQNAHHH